MTKTTVTTEPVKRLPDAKLAKMAKERLALKAELDAIQKEVKAIDSTLLTELERRNTHLIETNGFSITRAQATRVETDYEALLPELTPKQRKMVTKTVVDSKAVAAAVGAGLIDVALVDKHSTLKLNAAYLVVKEVG